MDMNGRGPRDGQRGSDGRGFNFSFGFRPTRMRRRSLGFLFPFGALFALPGLMIGGWVTIMVLGIIVNVFGSILGGIFSGLTHLTSHIFSGSGFLAGAVIGFLAYMGLRRRNARKIAEEEEEHIGTVDNMEVRGEVVQPEEEYVEPVKYNTFQR